jgi:hypothetical protein
MSSAPPWKKFESTHADPASRRLERQASGQVGTAERVLNQVAPAQQNAYPEEVLIQAQGRGETFTADPAVRQAVSQVAASLAAQPGHGSLASP